MSSSPCKFCGYPISSTATECEQCGAGTPYGHWLEEDQKLSGAVLIKCPACQADVSNQAVRCPHCGQPMRAEKLVSPPTQPSQARLPLKQKTKTNPLVIGCLAIIAVPVACVIFANIINTGSRNSGNQNSSVTQTSGTNTSTGSPSQPLSPQRNMSDDIQTYRRIMKTVDRDGNIITNVAPGRIEGETTITVSNLWHYQPYQVRLQTAQNLWSSWANIHSPTNPDKAESESSISTEMKLAARAFGLDRSFGFRTNECGGR